MKNIVLAIVLIFSLTFAGCSGKSNTNAKEVPTVEVMSVEAHSVTDEYDYIGTVEEVQAVALSFQSIGNVEQVFVEEGDYVRRGQLLARLDKTSVQSLYDAAQATLRQAEDAYGRMQKLHDNGSLPEIQWVEIESKLQTARSSEQVARKALENTELHAPKEGLIAKRNIEVGETTVAGATAFKLVDINDVHVKVAIPEGEISSITEGTDMSMKVKALDDKTVGGKVVSKSLEANPLSHTYDIKIKVSNRDHTMLPGMLCKVSIASDADVQRIVIPQNVVMLDFDNSRFVWVADGDKAVKRTVETGDVTYGGIVVTAGLSQGESIIVGGMQKVSDGMNIKIEKR